jgi:hypothetical protein
VLWAATYLGALTVGAVILPLAVLLTVLLGKDGLAPTVRRWVWAGWIAWLAWWLLVLVGPAAAGAQWMVLGGVAFMCVAAVAGPASAGLLFGVGATAALSGPSGAEPRLAWVAGGSLTLLTGLAVFMVARSVRVAGAG